MKNTHLDKTLLVPLVGILLSSGLLIAKIPFNDIFNNKVKNNNALASRDINHISSSISKYDLCDESGNIKNTSCPCPPEDSGLASVCGTVVDANITVDSSYGSETSKTVYAVDKPVEGVTVSIYEYTEGFPTGKPYGDLENKLGDCVTSSEGRYHCLMRKVSPGLKTTVVYSCGGNIKKVLVIPSYKNFTNLDVRVACSGVQQYAQLPTPLQWINRGDVASCNTTPNRDDVPDASASLSITEEIRVAANIEEQGGDIRYSTFSGIASDGILADVADFISGGEYTGLFSHGGAYTERDCLAQYSASGNLEHEFEIGGEGYDSIEQKCNFDPQLTGTGLQERERPDDYMTAPFEYALPTFSSETEKVRTVEGKALLTRQVTENDAPAQANQTLFSECVHRVKTLSYGQEDDSYDKPVPCEVLKKCCGALDDDPYRNDHTTASFGARNQLPISWQEIYDTEERERDDPACSLDGEVVYIGEIQPPYTSNNCVPGESNCEYKLDSSYFCPQFLVAAGGVRTSSEFSVENDRYDSAAPREVPWELMETEALNTHREKNYSQRPDNSKEFTNSGLTALRVTSDKVGTAGGILTDPFAMEVDRLPGDYSIDIAIDSIIYDYGDSPVALCSVSNVNDNKAILPFGVGGSDSITESNVNINNLFEGMSEDHEDYKSASTFTYASDWAQERDEYLGQEGGTANVGEVNLKLRDAFDSLLRLKAQRNNEGGNLRLVDFISTAIQVITSDGREYKSFAQRTDDFTDVGYPSVMNVEYCIAEFADSGLGFNAIFPSISEEGYPGGEGFQDCYPWNDLESSYGSRIIPRFTFQEEKDPGSQYIPPTLRNRSGEYHYSFCNVWPTKSESEWPPFTDPNKILEYPQYQGLGALPPWPGANPDDLADEMRTCKINDNNCAVLKKTRVCDEYVQVRNTKDGLLRRKCGDENGDGSIDSHIEYSVERCQERPIENNWGENGIAYNCLKSQRESWILYEHASQCPDPTDSGKTECSVWQTFDDPDEYEVDGEGSRGGGSTENYACDLSRAGPMIKPGDIKKDQAQLISKGDEEFSAEGIEATSNYVEALWSLPKAENNIWGIKAAEEDTNTTLDAEPKKGQERDTTTWLTTGKLTRNPIGVGNTMQLQSRVNIPIGKNNTQLLPYADIPNEYSCNDNDYGLSNWCPSCNIDDPGYIDLNEDDRADYGEANWCAKILPPEEEIIDIDELEVGNCMPKLGGNCPYISEETFLEARDSGEYTTEELESMYTNVIGEDALRILGAAGHHAGGIPGSLLLAIIEKEGWSKNIERMLWTDDYIEKYSAPWYGRIYSVTPNGLPSETCNDMNFTFSGPFGWIDKWFIAAVNAGGYHPSRISKSTGKPVVSKCNFLDAAYAAAWAVSYNLSDTGYCGGSLTEDQARILIAKHGGHSPEKVAAEIAKENAPGFDPTKRRFTSYQMQGQINTAINCQ